MTVPAVAAVARTGASRAAGASAAKGATVKAGGAAAASGGSAARKKLVGRMLEAGGTREQAIQYLREQGSTAADAKALVDQVDPPAAADPPDAGTSSPEPGAAPTRVRRSPASQQGAPKAWRTATMPITDPVRALNAGGGAILGVLAYVLTLTYLRGGRAGVRRWLSAKFLNKVTP